MTQSTNSVEYWSQRAMLANERSSIGWIDTEYDFMEHTARVFRILQALIPKSAVPCRVLDVGCAWGRFARHVEWHCKGSWVGLDFCPAFKERWEREVNLGQFILGDANDPNVPLRGQGKFDTIIAVGVVGNLGHTGDSFWSLYSPFLKEGGAMLIAGLRQFDIRWSAE